MYKIAVTLTVIGSLFLVLAIALPFVFPKFFDSQITKKLIIRPDSEMLKTFSVTPIPLYFQIWLFNLTNPDEVLEGAKPVLREIGPFTYEQYRRKDDVHFNNDIGTVLFQPKQIFYFKPELSYGPETLQITTIDPVYMSLASKISGNNIPDAAKSIVQLLFLRFEKKPFMTHSAGELLFHGYHEPVLGELYKVTKDPGHKRAKFGFFLTRNATSAGEVEIFSGQLGMSNYQHILKWQDKSILEFWKEERCNKINGTDGAQFVRPVRKTQPLYLFSSELCRSIYAVYEKDVKLGPITLNRFVLPPELLDNSPDNDCFCSSNFTCKASMIDISPCRNGSPVVASTPHFYQGSKEDQEAVVGLNPNKDEHETYLDVEPTTGVSMRIAKRLQINMPLKRYANFPSLASIQEVVLPIFWVNESIEVPMARVEKLHVTLTLPLMVVNYGSWALLGLGILLIVIACILTFLTYRRNQKLQKRRQHFDDRLNDSSNNKVLLAKKT